MLSEKDKQYHGLALDIANRFSRDNSTKVGCIIVDPDTYDILATGYNGFPRKVNETAERQERPAKYIYTEHAERNCIDAAARRGTRLEGATAYVTMFPCSDCAKGLIQAGIKRLVSPAPDATRWAESHKYSLEMLHESGVSIVYRLKGKGDEYV